MHSESQPHYLAAAGDFYAYVIARHVSSGHWANRPSASNSCSISLPINKRSAISVGRDVDDVRRHASRTPPIVNRREDTSVAPNRSPPRQPINGTRQLAISDKSRWFRSDDRSALEPRVFPECSPQLVSGLLPDRSFPRGFFVVRRGPLLHFRETKTRLVSRPTPTPLSWRLCSPKPIFSIGTLAENEGHSARTNLRNGA